MQKYLFLWSMLLVIICSSCKMNVLKGEGNKTTTTLSASSFNAIDMSLPLKAVITVQDGAQPTVQITGYGNVIKHIRAKTDNNILHLSTDLDDTWTIDGEDVTVTITLPALTSLSLTGSSDADVHGNINGSGFSLDISGASKVVIDNLNVDSFTTTISGAGDLDIKGGAVKHAVYDISGAGKIQAFPLQATEASATISGAGKSEVTVLQKLTANINGAGSIKYKGHPVISQEVAGVGSISSAD